MNFSRVVRGVVVALIVGGGVAGCSQIDINAPLSSPSVSSASPSGSVAKGESHVADNYFKVVSEGKAEFSPWCPDKPGFVYQGVKDKEIGQVGAACGLISKEIYVKELSEERESIKHLVPAGYVKNKQVAFYDENGREYAKDWFYNRSHLIADSLGGEASLNNLVAGTRTQNVGMKDGGMAYMEEKVRQYLQDAPAGCPVRYEVAPQYDSEFDKVPRTVLVNAASCDDTINETVVVYNDAEGYMIDYATGAWSPNM